MGSAMESVLVDGADSVQKGPAREAVPQVAQPKTGSKSNRSASLATLCTVAAHCQIAADPDHLAQQVGLSPSESSEATSLLVNDKQLGVRPTGQASSAFLSPLCPHWPSFERPSAKRRVVPNRLNQSKSDR